MNRNISPLNGVLVTFPPREKLLAQQGETLLQNESIFLIGTFQQIIYTHMIKIRQSTKHMGRNHPLSALIVGISSLWKINGLAHLFLSQIMVFAQITNSLVLSHYNHQSQYS